MKLVDVELNAVNGSELWLLHPQAGRRARPSAEAAKRIAKVRFDEFNMALDTDAPYQKFKENIERNRQRPLVLQSNQERSKGKKVFVYGASTKGNVLLQYCGLTERLIPVAAERNPREWGARTLGSNIPIVSEEEARAMKPDYFLVLPYHFLDEMMEREKEFIGRGGRFIVPVPTVKVVP